MLSTRGFSLIQLLITLQLLLLVLMAFSKGELFTLAQSQKNYFLALGASQLKNIYERLYAVKFLPTKEIFFLWQKENEALLPHPHYQIKDNAKENVISLFWGIQQNKICNQLSNMQCLKLNIMPV